MIPLSSIDTSGPSFQRLVTDHLEGGAFGVNGWRIEHGSAPHAPWMLVRNTRGQLPAQGWKIHVSAGVASAETVLRRILPVVLAEDATFKVASTLDALNALNDGSKGFSQIGKFITVYPEDGARAVRLAVALHEATRGLRGPDIPSDRRLRAGSLVFYRYGGFSDRQIKTSAGHYLPAISDPDGALVADERTPTYQAPAWEVDPFVAASAADPLPLRNPLIAGRYLTVSALHYSARGAVFLGLDLATAKSCILKEANRDAQMSGDGRDARDRLRQEARVLARLAPDGRVPAFYDLVDADDRLILVMEDIEGETLEDHLRKRSDLGCFASATELATWGRELASILDALHRHGIVYRDLKPANVIVTPEHRLRLIDFEIAYDMSTDVPPDPLGTRGYVSPEQAMGQTAMPTHDIYSLGAVLYFVATGAAPGMLPESLAPLRRPLALLNPGIDPVLAQVVVRCLDADPARRFSSMSEVDAALADTLAAIGGTPSRRPAIVEPAASVSQEALCRSRDMARQLGDALCHAALRAPDGSGTTWLSTYRGQAPRSTRDIYNGDGGIALALAELFCELRVPQHKHVLESVALGLLRPPAGEPTQILPGLYTGEAGVSAALLRAGQVLGEASLIDAAVERGRWVAAQPYGSPDLIVGTAGRLRLHLLLWDETGDPECLRDAIAAGEALLATAEDIGCAECRWTIPPGYEGLSGTAYCGYAHGAAGIADVLLDLFEATTNERYLAAARGAGRWLNRVAVPTLDDGSGLGWPLSEGAAKVHNYWCYGAPGIGQFFLHAARLGAFSNAADTAARAARATARGARGGDPTRCHGLAGNIEFLLDMAQATGDPTYLAEAGAHATLLEAFAVRTDGLLRWSSDSPDVLTPDYMVGFGGVALCLLRLSDPWTLPSQLTRQGFGRRPSLTPSFTPSFTTDPARPERSSVLRSVRL